MELFKLLGTIAVENDKANKAIDDTTDKAETSSNKMVNAFKKIGTAVAAAFAIEKIVSFGKELVNAAAEVAAEEAAFAQIMGDYSDAATEKINKIADATGMVSTRLTPYMTSMTAKFKGLGYDIDEATDLASTGLNIAADASAFWDKSLDDSMSALNSFVNGNYEGGEAIGLFANETTLASWASENLGLTWKDLSEKEKQFARLEFAKSMQEASGAAGQAAKESGSYANVMGNFAETWRQLKATVGEPLLEALIPVIQHLAASMEKIMPLVQELSNGFLPILMDSVDKLLPPLLEMSEQVIPLLVESAQVLLPPLIEIVTKLLPVISKLIMQILPPLMSLIERIMPMVVTLIEAICDILDPLLELISPILDLIIVLLEPLISLIEEIFPPLLAIIAGLAKVIATVLKPVIEAITKVFKSFFNKTLEDSGKKGIEVKNKIDKAFSDLIASLKKAWEGFKNFIAKIWDGLKNTISSMKTGFSNFTTNIKNTFSNAWNTIKSKTSSTWEKIKDAILKPINAAKTAVEKIIDKIKEIFNNMKLKLPKIKVPKFSISPAGWKIGDLLKGIKPKLSIKWNAEGAIFNKPTIFDTAYGYQGVGEAGAEAIAPIDKLMGYVQAAVKSETSGMNETMNVILNILQSYFPQILNNSKKQIVLNNGVLVGELAPTIDEKLGHIYEGKGRGR